MTKKEKKETAEKINAKEDWLDKRAKERKLSRTQLLAAIAMM